MKTIENYMDDLKELTGSDYKSAQAMGIDRSIVSNIRKRGAIADENAVKVAELLGIDPTEILLAAAMARSQGAVKEAWANVSKRAGIAAGLAIYALLPAVERVICILCKIYGAVKCLLKNRAFTTCESA